MPPGQREPAHDAQEVVAGLGGFGANPATLRGRRFEKLCRSLVRRERFGCPPAEYEERAFWACLYWHAKLLAPLLRRLNPDFFKQDFSFIHYAGEASGLREVRANMADFQDTNSAHRGLLRTRLRIRVSGRKAGAAGERVVFKVRSCVREYPPGRAPLKGVYWCREGHKRKTIFMTGSAS